MPRPHRAARRAPPRVHHRRRRGRPRGGARARGRARRRPLAWTVARRAARLQRPLPRVRPSDVVRHQDTRILPLLDRVHGGDPSPGGRRGHARQAEHDGAGDGALRGQRPSWRCPEPVAARALRRRLEQRLGRRRRRRIRRGGARQRHGRLHQTAGSLLRCRRSQADVRARESRGRDAAVVVAGPPGSADPNRGRRRAGARDRRRARPTRRDVEPAGRAVLPADAREPGRRPPRRRSGELLLRRDRPRDGSGRTGRRAHPRRAGRPRDADQRSRSSAARGHLQRDLSLGVRRGAHPSGARATARAAAGGPGAAGDRLPHRRARLSAGAPATRPLHTRVHP